MSHASDLFRPNRMKLLLAATLIVPAFFCNVLIYGFPFHALLPAIVTAVVISYGAAWIIDEAIQTRTVKIAIASFAALLSLILAYFIVRSMTMVCDPVHEPGGVICDPVHLPPATPTHTVTVAPTVITTAPPHPTTPMIFDPVHEPSSCGPDACTAAPGVATGIVAEKLGECLRDCGK